MHLKQLRVSGFKSFADDQVINFNSGLTAIVGPNGCGKTNIIDTIRWVLGEQRVRILRAEKMEDVIFSGTIRRKPLNFAEATLTIDNRDRSLQSDADTVQITRRIFRTGESEYLVNKKLCRLKDLHTLFFDTGMGLGSYSLIEQKMIDLILSDKDEERRIMFEEAAGIHKYRSQRKEALRNLLKTSDDLKRISDIVGEKDRYVKSLARHVTKAQKYREYRDELKKIEVAYTGAMFRGVCEKMKEAGRSHAELKSGKESMAAEIATIETHVEEKRLESHAREEKVMHASQETAAIAERIHTLEKEMALVSAKTEAAHRAVAELGTRHTELESKAAILAENHKGHEGRLIEQEAGLKSAEEAYAMAKQELDAVEADYQEKKQHLAGINTERLRVLEERTELLSRMEKIRSDLDNLLENKAAIERTIESEERRIEECGQRISESKAVLNRATTEYEAFAATRDRLHAKIQEEEQRYRQILEEEKNLSAHLISDRKSLTFIEEMQKNHEGYKDAVRSIVERSLDGIAGIVADVINVNPEYLAPVEAALGSRVQFILADTREIADQAIAYLQEGKMGKASFIIHNQINTGERAQHLAALESIEGVLGWMEKFVSFQEKYVALSGLLFGDVLLVKDAAAADRVRAAAGTTALYCVTPDGTIYNTSGIVRGGEFTSEELGLLSRAKVIETLKESIRKLETQIQFKEGEKAASLQTIKEAQMAMLEIDEKLSSGQRVRQEQEGSIRYLDEEIMRIQARKNESLEKIRIIDARCEETREDEQNTERSLGAIEDKKTELEGSLIICEEEAGALERRRFEVTEKAKNTEVALQSVIHQLDSTRREIGRMTGELEDTYAALADCRRQQQAYEGE
ncbi:MAG: chromosome segregation protein SMC, partial [Candidatus Raymondbacteria bacterium RIFOXYD12_FULL_49_13]